MQTLRRGKAATPLSLHIITNAAQAALAQDELSASGIPAEILIEPSARNTGPAIALAASLLAYRGLDSAVVFLPADHYIPDTQAFADCLRRAAALAESENVLVVLGKQPDRPETGYGYIERGAPLQRQEISGGAYRVKRFVEKPDRDTALQYLQAGTYWWNTGLVIARPSVLLGEVREHAPAMAAAVINPVGVPVQYAEAPKESFDVAVLEKSRRVAVVEASFPWSDVGNWAAWSEQAPQDRYGNATQADGKVYPVNAKGNAVWSTKPVVLQDVDDLVIIETDHVLFVTRKSSAQHIGQARQAVAADKPELL